MKSKIKLYIAGPLGFSEAGRAFYYERFIPSIKKTGSAVLDPWELAPLEKIEEIKAKKPDPTTRRAWQRLNMEIGRNNEQLIQAADGLIAVLDGSDVDSGTAAEIGFAYAKGKPVLGYRTDIRASSENEGGIVNIQVEYFIRASGGLIATSLKELQAFIEQIFMKSVP
jgi:nucleoside 2-deoxyribosyltransferase